MQNLQSDQWNWFMNVFILRFPSDNDSMFNNRIPTKIPYYNVENKYWNVFILNNVPVTFPDSPHYQLSIMSK